MTQVAEIAAESSEGVVGLPGTWAERVLSPSERELARVYRADAVDWLRSLPAESVDLVITDPAYESLEKHRKVGTTTRLKHSKSSSNDWFEIFPNTRFADLFAEVYRVLRRDSHFYMFCDQETMFVAKPIAEAAGFKFWKPIVWDKQTIGMGYHYRARYEFVLFFEKGKRKLNDLGIPDVIDVPRVRGWRCDRCESQSSTPRDTSRSSSMVDGESNITSSGRNTTDRYRQDSRSTTATRSRATTESRICSSSTPQSTSESILGVNSETVSGGSHAPSARSSSRSPSSTGTLTRPGNSQPLDDAEGVTSEPLSSGSSVCARCGGPRSRVWPTEKPVGVNRVLIEQSSAPGELVIDPFMGSASCGVAAVQAGRMFAGCDLSASAVDLAAKRLAIAAAGGAA